MWHAYIGIEKGDRESATCEFMIIVLASCVDLTYTGTMRTICTVNLWRYSGLPFLALQRDGVMVNTVRCCWQVQASLNVSFTDHLLLRSCTIFDG